MEQSAGMNAMNLGATMGSLNNMGAVNSNTIPSMISGVASMASMPSMNPMSMMGADHYQPQQPYHQQSYQPQQAYQQQYPQLQLQQYQQQPQQQYQRVYQHQPALPMASTLSSLEGNCGSSNEQPPANDYREFKEKALDVCREFMRGFCNRSEDRCKFAHPPPFVDVKEGKVIVCFDFTKNRCRRTQPPCRYMHPPPHLCPDFGNTGGGSGRRSSSRSGDYRGGRDGSAGSGQGGFTRRSSGGQRGFDRGPLYDDQSYEGFQGGAGARRGGNGYEDVRWGPAPSRGGYGGGMRRDDNRRDSGRSNSGGSSWGGSYQGRFQNEGPRSDQIEVCREFMRNNCDRQECKYAHPPSHVKVENGQVVYCIDHIVKGSCRKGDECRYFHMPRHLAIRYGKIDMRGQKRTYDQSNEDGSEERRYSSPSGGDDDQLKKDQDAESEGTPTVNESVTDAQEVVDEKTSVSEVVPEVAPDVVPEVAPEVVPEVAPEVVPEEEPAVEEEEEEEDFVEKQEGDANNGVTADNVEPEEEVPSVRFRTEPVSVQHWILLCSNVYHMSKYRILVLIFVMCLINSERFGALAASLMLPGDIQEMFPTKIGICVIFLIGLVLTDLFAAKVFL